MTPHHIGDGCAAALVGNVRELGGRRHVDHFNGEVGAGAVARGCHAEPAGLGLVLRQHIGERFQRAGRGCDQDVREGGQIDHGQQLLLCVAQLGVELGCDGVHRNVCQQQGVAVSRRLGNQFGTQGAACTGFVFNDKRLACGFAQFLAQGARQNV